MVDNGLLAAAVWSKTTCLHEWILMMIVLTVSTAAEAWQGPMPSRSPATLRPWRCCYSAVWRHLWIHRRCFCLQLWLLTTWKLTPMTGLILYFLYNSIINKHICCRFAIRVCLSVCTKIYIVKCVKQIFCQQAPRRPELHIGSCCHTGNGCKLCPEKRVPLYFRL